jgi:hypothetical protein
MATRFKSTDLKDMIRSIVREEMKSVVAAAINEVLSERYLKEMAQRMVEAQRPRLRETILGTTREPEEETPEPLDNDTEGIYTKNPIKKGVSEMSLPEALAENNPLAYLYEGVSPIPAEGAMSFDNGFEEPEEVEPAPMPTPGRRPAAPSGEVRMQVEHGEYGRGTLEVKPDLMQKIVKQLEKKKPTFTAQDQALLEQRLAERRKMLEVKPQ